MKKYYTPYIYILFFLISFSSVKAQEYQLYIFFNNDSLHPVSKKIKFQKKLDNKKNVFNQIDSVKTVLKKMGYLNTYLKKIDEMQNTFTAFFELEKKISTIKIYYTQITKKEIAKHIPTDYIEINDTYLIIPFEHVSKVMQNITDYFEQIGYSFTSIHLSDIRINENSADAVLQIENSNKRTVDKIIVEGYEKFPQKFLKHALNLKSETPFNKDILKKLTATINQLNFVEATKPPEVLFTKDSTYIYLFLKKKRANQFDGVLGFASKENGNGIEFNGYLDFKLQNIFNSGESIFLFWKNNGNNNQRFYLATSLPYLFKSPITPGIQFEIFRKDTTFNNTTFNLNMAYTIPNFGDLSALLSTENSNNLQDQNLITDSTKSYNNLFYGLNYSLRKLNSDQMFPLKYYINLSVLAGNRKINDINTNQFKFTFTGSYIYPFNKKNHIFIQNQSSFLQSDNYVNNELFRIGGTNSIRGINEESIFTSLYTVFNFEYRFKPNAQNYFYSITDFSYFENKISFDKSNIFGLGIGYAFLTKMGIINLSYAIAKQNNNSFGIENSKIHIKILSFF